MSIFKVIKPIIQIENRFSNVPVALESYYQTIPIIGSDYAYLKIGTGDVPILKIGMGVCSHTARLIVRCSEPIYCSIFVI